jgi:hypothetical protein
VRAVLLVCLASAVGASVAFLAFLLARVEGRSYFVAIRSAGVTFVATVTLCMTVLGFLRTAQVPQPVWTGASCVSAPLTGQVLR